MTEDKDTTAVMVKRIEALLAGTVAKVCTTTVPHAEELIVKDENNILADFHADAVITRTAEDAYTISVRLFSPCRYVPNIPCPACLLNTGPCQKIYSADEKISATADEVPKAWHQAEIGGKPDQIITYSWVKLPNRWHPAIEGYD